MIYNEFLETDVEGKFMQGIGRGQVFLIVNRLDLAIQGSPEKAWKSKGVVDLVVIIRIETSFLGKYRNIYTISPGKDRISSFSLI